METDFEVRTSAGALSTRKNRPDVGTSATPIRNNQGGEYHGIIMLSADYPYKPPNIMWLTPNGRFEVRKKICLSISAHHPEHWQPAWGVRTIVEALISFMPAPGNGAIGALDWTSNERRKLAAASTKKSVPLPSEYREHLRRWKEKFPTLSKEENRAAQQSIRDNDLTSSLHFHRTRTESRTSNDKDEEGEKNKSTTTLNGRDTKDARETTIRRRPTRTQTSEASPSQVRTSQHPQAAASPIPQPNHLVEFAGFLVIAILIAVVFSVARVVVKL